MRFLVEEKEDFAITGEVVMRISLTEDDLKLTEEKMKASAASMVDLLFMWHRVQKERFGEAIVKFCHTGKDIYART